MPNNNFLVTFVLPCLNEEKTLPDCLLQIKEIEAKTTLQISIIVADNGSTDGSSKIARDFGAQVVNVPKRGYGATLFAGCSQADGEFIIIGDADGSYNFNEAIPMLYELEAGADLVVGSRLKGDILPNAMPWLHRYVGNPVLTNILKFLFHTKVTDAHSGLRAFKKTTFDKLKLRSSGMEFASEMLIKASILNMSIAEVPITLSPDGRERKPHLRTWKDGWRHLKLLILYSPEWLYLFPGLFFLILGLGLNIALNLVSNDQYINIGTIFIGTHWTIPATLFATLGMQMLWLGVLSKSYSIKNDLYPSPNWFIFVRKHIYIERSLFLGILLIMLGLAVEGYILSVWLTNSFGVLDELRLGIFGMMWFILGIELVLNSFFFDLINSDELNNLK